MNDMKQRGCMAARAFIERLGMDVLEDNEKNEIIAMDDGVLVHVTVLTADGEHALETQRKRSKTIKKRVAELAEFAQENNWDSAIRLDEVTIRVLEHDRALLRHNRDVKSK